MTIHRMLRRSTLAAAFVVAGIGAAQADELRPAEGRSIDLGAVSGAAYYTVEPAGYRVVATLAEGETGTPVRVEAVLAQGQSVVLSIPGATGASPDAVEISRYGDQVSVEHSAVTN